MSKFISVVRKNIFASILLAFFIAICIGGSSDIRIDGEYASRHGETVTEIFSMDDFPAPDAGVITLSSGLYVIKESISTANRFECAPGASITITTPDSRNVLFTYTGTDTFFTFANAFRIGFSSNNFVCSGAGAQFMDISAAVLEMEIGVVTFEGAGATSIGSFQDGDLAIRNKIFFGFTNGLSIINSRAVTMSEMLVRGNQTGSGALINFSGSIAEFSSFRQSSLITGPSEASLFICPSIKKIVNVSNVSDSGTGEFWQTGTTGPIASFTDVSTDVTAVDVTDDSGDALFTSVGHGLVVGELPVHTTFTEILYNTTTDVVTEVPTANTYKIGIDYESDDSGLFETTTCQVNDVEHGLSNEDQVSIFGTINFLGGYIVFNSQTDVFEITLGKAFPGSEATGNWDTSSLNETSPYVVGSDNGLEKNSANVGSFIIGGNTAEVTISETGVYYDLDLDALAVSAPDNELWTLVDTTTGALRYDGIVEKSMHYNGLVAPLSAGAANKFEFQLFIDDGGGFDEIAAPEVPCPVSVAGTLNPTPVRWGINVQPGYIYKMMHANVQGTSNIVVDTVKIDIE